MTAEPEVSLSKKSVALMVMSCFFIVFLLRPSKKVSDTTSVLNVGKDSLERITESQYSDPVSTEPSLLSKPTPHEPGPPPRTVPAADNPKTTNNELQIAPSKDLYLNPPSQEWIQDQFEKALSDLGLEYSPDSLWSSCGAKTYYFPKINTIFTGTPKTGCSNWIEALLRAEGDLTKELDPTKIKQVHGKISGRHRMPHMREQYNDTTLRKAFSFTVVRNPWTRMVSGYRDKLSDEDTQGGDKRSIGVRIVQEMRGVTDSVVKTEKLYPTFAEYASWIVKHRGNINVHFSPQFGTLCVPKAKYDIVVPLEYAGPLGGEVLKRINANNTSVLGSYDQSSDPRLQKSALYAKEWLSELDSDVVEQLYSIYKTDFTLLNYSNFSHPDFPLPLYDE